MDGQLFTWEALSAMGGASLLTYFVVQYTKRSIDRIAANRLPTDLYAVIVAGAILVIAQLALGADPRDWRVYMLAMANGFLVAATAGQMQRKAMEPPGSQTGTETASARIHPDVLTGQEVHTPDSDAQKQSEPEAPTSGKRTESAGQKDQSKAGNRSDGA